MKPFLALITLSLLLFSCGPSEEELKSQAIKKEARMQFIADSLEQVTADSLKQVFLLQKQDSLLKIEHLAAIKIKKYYSSRPNSAGGVDCNIIWTNLSPKTVKYASFSVDAYNAVNDIVYSDYGGETKTCKDTGPVKQGKTSGNGTYWECLWYNSTIDHMRIKEIALEYMDGSKLTIDNVETIKELGYFREDNK